VRACRPPFPANGGRGGRSGAGGFRVQRVSDEPSNLQFSHTSGGGLQHPKKTH